MAWGSEFPPTQSFNPFDYSSFIQIYKAINERQLVAFGGRFPAPVWSYGSGFIYQITSTTATAYHIRLVDESDVDVNYRLGDSPFDSDPTRPLPGQFDIVIEIDEWRDEKRIIRTEVESIVVVTADPYVSELAIKRQPIDDAITGNLISSVTGILDKHWVLTRRYSANYPHWHERIPAWPNSDSEDWIGNMSAFTPTTITRAVTDVDPAWTVDQFAGRYVWYTVGSALSKARINSNSTDTLTLSAGSPPPLGGGFRITQTNTGLFKMNSLDSMNRWYRGKSESYYSYLQTNTSSATLVDNPVRSVEWFVDGETIDLFDNDAFVIGDAAAGVYSNPNGYIASPDLFKCYRGLQLGARNLVSAFIPPIRDYDGEAHIPQYTLATWMFDAKVGLVGVIATFATDDFDGATRVRFVIPPPHPVSGSMDIELSYSVCHDNAVLVDVPNANYSPTEFVHEIGTQYGGAPIEIYYSYGETRKLPREFTLMFDKTYFLPTVPVGVATSDTNPGEWITRPKSDRYREFDRHGGAIETEEFQEFDYARYVGDVSADARITQFFSGANDTTGVREYHSRGCEGMAPSGSVRDAVDAQNSGTILEGSTTRQVVCNKSWWTDPLFGTRVMPTHTAVALPGSSDTSILANLITDFPGYFATDTGRPEGFILEVQLAIGTEYRPISAFDRTAGTITVDPAFSSSTAGRTWTIREPTSLVLNKFKGRTVTITKSNLTTESAVITHSDNTRLYLATALSEAPSAGWTFSIDEPPTGTVWRRSSNIWNKVGTYAQMRGLAPTAVRRYGMIRKNEYISAEMIEDLYTGLNYLIWTRGGVAWHNYGRGQGSLPPVPENNSKSIIQIGIASQAEWDIIWPIIVGNYDLIDAEPLDNTAPLAVSSGNIHFADPASGGATLIRYYAYAHTTVPEFFSCTVEMYCKPRRHTPEASPPDISVFDNNGDSVGETENAFHRFSTPSVLDGLAVSDQIGNLDVPNNPPPFPGEPEDPDIYFSDKGYLITEETAIVKWNVGGGFTYAILSGGGLGFRGGPGPGDEYYPPDEDGWQIEPEGATAVDAPAAGETAWFWYPI